MKRRSNVGLFALGSPSPDGWFTATPAGGGSGAERLIGNAAPFAPSRLFNPRARVAVDDHELLV